MFQFIQFVFLNLGVTFLLVFDLDVLVLDLCEVASVATITVFFVLLFFLVCPVFGARVILLK